MGDLDVSCTRKEEDRMDSFGGVEKGKLPIMGNLDPT